MGGNIWTKSLTIRQGNAFSQPGLGSVVPVGKPFTITWNPTTPGTVTLVLLKGPAQNLAVVGPIVEQIPNSGSYDWTPSADLAPGQTGYGIQLIVDSTGQYQYTTQFGISNTGYTGSDSSSSVSSSSYSQSTSSSSAKASYMVAPGITSSAPVRYSTSVATLSTYTVAPSSVGQSSYAAHSSSKPSNGTSYSATFASYTATPSASAPATTTSVTTGGASGMTASLAGLVVAAGVAVFAL